MPTDDRSPIPDREPLAAALAWLGVVVAMVLLALLTHRVERTPDELNYQLAGRSVLRRAGLHDIEERFQGPVILLGTQLTDRGGRADNDASLHRARLGMLVFPAVLLVVLVRWARRAIGDRGSCGVAWLAATNPTLLAYGPLLSSDIAFTAMGVLASWLVWRWLQRPGVASLAATGLGLGLLAGTKYTAVLPLFGLVGVVVVVTCLGFDAWPHRSGTPRRLSVRLAGTIAALSLAGTIALGTLYAAYLFAESPFPAAAVAELKSPALRALAAAPGGTTLLGLLPEPYVLGVDYQAVWAGTTQLGNFGTWTGNHWAFYPSTVLLKSPLALLVAAVLGALVARRNMAPRGTWLVVVVPAAILLTYCSATRALQMGIRYVLPVVPAMLLLGGAFVASRFARTWPGRLVLAVIAAGSFTVVATGWPHFIGFFNLAGGGPANGYRLCANGNVDWFQRVDTGREALRQRHRDLVFLDEAAGPRFGRVAIYTQDLKAIDPRDPARTYHWLDRFTPFDRDGAAWLAYDVTPDAFADAIASGDARAADDLALAWLRENDLAKARQAVAPLPGAAADAGRTATAALVEMVAAAGTDASARDAAAEALATAGQFELALALLDRTQRTNAVKVFWLLRRTGAHVAAIDFLESAGADGTRTVEEVALLAASLLEGGGHRYPPQPMRALELIQRGPAPAPDSPGYGPWQEFERRVRFEIEHARRLESR